MKNLLILMLSIMSFLFSGLGFAQVEMAEGAPEKDKGPWHADAAFIAVINKGNSDSVTVGGQKLVGYKGEKNQVEWDTRFAYGESKVAGVKTTNTDNLRSEIRYNRYLTEHFGPFALAHAGYDNPAGFNTRYGAALGIFHLFLKTDMHQSRYELGPDYTHEDRALAPNADIYSARVALYYDLKISDDTEFNTNVVSLFNLEDENDVRLTNFNKLKTKLVGALSFFVGFDVRADFQPVPGFKKVDTETRLGLEISFL